MGLFMAELNSLDYEKGSLRIWIVLSIIWTVVMIFDYLKTTYVIREDVTYCSSDRYTRDILDLREDFKDEQEKKVLECGGANSCLLDYLDSYNTGDKINEIKRICNDQRKILKEENKKIVPILLAPVLAWFVLLFIIRDVLLRCFLWIKSGFKEKE
tara:strand:+ start:93 stop:560 length:468 start_codon:yes stop_codon:yes gene_type:complete